MNWNRFQYKISAFFVIKKSRKGIRIYELIMQFKKLVGQGSKLPNTTKFAGVIYTLTHAYPWPVAEDDVTTVVLHSPSKTQKEA